MIDNTASKQNVCPVPLWALDLLLITVECTAYFAVASTFLSDVSYVVPTVIAMLLAARVAFVLLSYTLSRVKGAPMAREDVLRFFAWVRFFLAELRGVIAQSLILVPFRTLFHTTNERSVASTGRVLLMQHGYVNSGSVWFFTARALERAGYRVFTIDQPVFAPIDTMAARLAARIDEVLAVSGESKLTLIAHSMGGLVCRAYLRDFGDAKVAQLITLGSPHHGTVHAAFALGKNGAQMRAGNEWLETLARTRLTVPFTSIYSVHDTIIAPQTSSIMPEATNVKLVGVGHVSMPSGVQARRAIVEALETVESAAKKSST